MEKLKLALGIGGLLLAISNVQAGVVTYTDRAAWQAAVGSSITTEDFNTNALGAVTNATAFDSGIQVIPSTPNPSDTRISAFAFGDIGEGNSLLTFKNATVNFNMADVFAFALDFADIDHDGASIGFGAYSYFFPTTGDADNGVSPDDFGFIGFVADGVADIPGSSFNILIEGFEAVAIDNLSFANRQTHVPEPGSLILMALGFLGLLVAQRMRLN